MSERFTRLASPNIAATVHVSPDSRYILLPVMNRPAAIQGWVVYDTLSGEMVKMPQPTPFTDLHKARDWVSALTA